MSGENLTPITRKEMFLAKAAGQNIETPTPITREEIFLSKISGGGGTSGATAYTVASVDKLPSDAPDGSTALVESDIIGTWVFDEYLGSYPENGEDYADIHIRFDVKDDTREYAWNCFSIMGRQDQLRNIEIAEIEYSWLSKRGDFETQGALTTAFYEQWIQGNETVTFRENTDNTDFVDWVRHNANRIKEGYTLYTRENGEWVYKCEVV